MNLGPRYEFLRELGRGGAGRVFLVRDTYLGRELALKLLDRPPSESGALEQIHKEFALLSQLAHPRLARAHDFGYLRGRPYFTREFIQGQPLGDVGETLELEPLVRVMTEVAEALAYLHESEILHLDVKPSNVIIRTIREGDPGSGPVLIDFGLFRRGFSASPGRKIRGSIPYMGPEYFRADPIGPWTDVYAFGVTFYRLLTGTHPRWSETGTRFQDLHRGDWDPSPEPPATERLKVPVELANLILRCLSLDWRYRYRSASQLFESLQELRGEAAIRPTAVEAPGRTIGRGRELARIESFLAGIAGDARSPRALLVTGPPGMGQSHLFQEVKLRAQTRGYRLYLETGYPGQSNPPGSLLRCLSIRQDSRDAEERRHATRWKRFLSRLRQRCQDARNDALDGERRLRHALEVSLRANSIREPMVLAVDGLQHCDEVSVELVIDLVRLLQEGRLDPEKPEKKTGVPAARPPLGVVVGYREEGPMAPLLRELSRRLLAPGGASIITLQPLGLEDTLRLYGRRGGRVSGDPDRLRDAGLSVHQETTGCPRKIVALAVGEGSPAGGRPTGESGALAEHRDRPLRPTALRLVEILSLLGRPAATSELAAFSGLSVAQTSRRLEELERTQLVHEESAAGGQHRWIAGPLAATVAGGVTAAGRRGLHRRIAERIVERLAGVEDPGLVEAVDHFAAAGLSGKVVEHGLRLARYLKSTFQNRLALDVYRRVHALLPATRKTTRLEVSLELADLHARAGDVDEGIRILRELHLRSRRVAGRADLRVLLQLAVLYSRKGDLRRADSLFSEGLAPKTANAPRPELTREEQLRFLNEHASLKTFLGEYAEALRLCEEGLRLGRGSRNIRVREAALNLHATRANVAVRRFDFDAAIRDFESALETAEAIGSLGNQAVILNNLGKVYSQCDRYQDAVTAFQEAEKICLRIDEGPSLAAIHANVAILQAKMGDYGSMEEALGKARQLGAGLTNRREKFFLNHARGLGRLFQGRYREARALLEEAIVDGRALGDDHVVAFDEVYRAEALIFEARYREASGELSRLGKPPIPARVRKMALARHAFLCSLMVRDDRVADMAERYVSLSDLRPVPFLDAWDSVFLAWARFLCGHHKEALGQLADARSFFRRHGLKSVGDLAALVEAEGLLLLEEETGGSAAGAGDRALRLIAGTQGRGNGLVTAIRSLLSARLIMARELAAPDRERCAGLLSEAGTALVGNPLPEWQARLEVLRTALRARTRTSSPQVGDARREIARELPPRSRKRYLEARHWKVWIAPAMVNAPIAARRSRRPSKRKTENTSSTRSLTARAGRKKKHLRGKLVGRSAGMKRLLSEMDRLRESDLPVLLEGETGSGKELVARVLHEESRRCGGPFLVVDCSTLPENLLESELFGARAGAYTGQTRDRQGILSVAEKGTVLIDGIDGVSLGVQAKLLRMLSENRIRPVGGEAEHTIDVRFIFSTSTILEDEVREGRFRADLFHRIHVVCLRIPPLRERRDDLRGLVNAFLAEGTGPRPVIGEAAWKKLRSFRWPGNVRQLRNIVARLRLESPVRWNVGDLELVLGKSDAVSPFPEAMLADEPLAALKDRLERDYVLYHFRRLGGKTPDLCALLGLNRRQFYYRLKRLGISLRKEKERLFPTGARRPPKT